MGVDVAARQDGDAVPFSPTEPVPFAAIARIASFEQRRYRSQLRLEVLTRA